MIISPLENLLKYHMDAELPAYLLIFNQAWERRFRQGLEHNW